MDEERNRSLKANPEEKERITGVTLTDAQEGARKPTVEYN